MWELTSIGRLWRRRARRVTFEAPATRGVHHPAGDAPVGDDRAYWVYVLQRLAQPVLANLAAGTLRASMPIEQSGRHDRRGVTHLEAFGRVLAGIAPWLELGADDTTEGQLRAGLLALTHRALANAVDPASPDFLNFTDTTLKQPLVDAAFLAQALVRAPNALTGALDDPTKQRLVSALESTRAIQPNFSNWLLFPAMVEAGLSALGAQWEPRRVEYALNQHEQWYVGDGTYSDGPEFHWDYYNSFVIQPMLLDVMGMCRGRLKVADEMAENVEHRARRFAAVLERLVAPDGTFPPLGRSLAYRMGAFHLLAQVALRDALPDDVSPAQVRCALTAVIHRSMDAPGTFDERGWLQIGFCGHQPQVGETYISTGSLYLCALVLLPLGLRANRPFWASPPEPWTSARAWSGLPMSPDRALPTTRL